MQAMLMISLGLSACGGGSGGGATAPPSSGGGPAKPAVVSLTLSASAVRVGENFTVQWNATNASSCTASGSWSGAKATSGSETLTATQVGASTFLLSCVGAGGSGNATASLNIVAALRKVNVPGAPAPIALADGECVSMATADYEVKCPKAPSEIGGLYDRYAGDSSARVTLANLNATPIVTAGGACSAGFDRLTSQFVLNSTFRNEAIPVTGAFIAEIVYSSQFLASLGVTADISAMSVLIFQDNSNSEHVGMIAYIEGAGGPLTFAVAGRVSDDETGAFDLLACYPADDDPTPPPTGLDCPEGAGSGRNGLEFLPGQDLSYEVTPGGANASMQGTMTWGVRYNNPNLSASSYTGSLRVSLWALETTFPGSGEFTGYRLLEDAPNFSGAGARSSAQLYNFYSVSNIVSVASGKNPPRGEYCVVMLLEMFDSQNCTTDDNYCYVDWAQFAGVQSFN